MFILALTFYNAQFSQTSKQVHKKTLKLQNKLTKFTAYYNISFLIFSKF